MLSVRRARVTAAPAWAEDGWPVRPRVPAGWCSVSKPARAR